MNDEMNERIVPCEICGEAATRYLTSFPICNNPVCLQGRLEHMDAVVKLFNELIESKQVEGEH